ncbi:MAG: type transport system ATP-binding protein [Chloroflexota bacterium]|jgi:ABC-2 type transport system ATP-binding protein|nr:type transport system ATP-binding protein [Chloroflexota bacterium]
MVEPAVRVDGLVKRYGALTAVDGLTLSVPSHAVTAILGPNGAGKTTTIECCEGFRRPDGGSVSVLGVDPTRRAGDLYPRVGVMLQSGGIYPSVRAGDILHHTARLYANPLDPEMLIQRLGLKTARRTTYRRMSGGQQQRLSLAMAVVGRPELVFLDEPTSGLDPQARRATWDLVRELRDDGVTVVLTTHLMDEAEELADEVVIIDHGRVVAAGSPRDLTRAGAEGTVRFEAPPGLDLESLQRALPPGTSATELTPGRYAVKGAGGPGLLAAVTGWCAAQDVMPRALGTDRRSLEDVFLELTGHDMRT